MLDPVPDENLTGLGSELGGGVDEKDYMDDSDDNWTTIPINPK
jgi:hypothetical protein